MVCHLISTWKMTKVDKGDWPNSIVTTVTPSFRYDGVTVVTHTLQLYLFKFVVLSKAALNNEGQLFDNRI